MKIAVYLAPLVVVVAAIGCTGPAYDSGQSDDLPIETPATSEQHDSTEDSADTDATTDDQDSGLSIDVGKEGVDVEVGEGVDVEVNTDGRLNVDVGTGDEAETETTGDQNDGA